MAGINGVSAYQQASRSYGAAGTDRTGQAASKETGQAGSASGSGAAGKAKAWSPVDSASSLVPKKTEYGNTIGDVKLSDEAKGYYEKLKSKFHNMEFIAVSKDMKSRVSQNASLYGNANKQVVLIDEEKLERMAADESFRKKYEGIIESSQSKLAMAKNSLASSGASVKNFGMSVDSNGKESFFATVGKSQDLQKKRIEKKAAEKKEQKVKEKKKAEKKAQEERIQRARDKKAEEASSKTEKLSEKEDVTGREAEGVKEEYLTFEANSMESLLGKVQAHSYENAADRVRTDEELTRGTMIDFKG